MKNIFSKALLLAFATTFLSCNNDDDNNSISGNGNLEIEFDNAFAANDLILNTQANATSQNEILKISSVKYIISNVVLTNENGDTFTYPKSQSYFVTSEASEALHVLELENVPAGNYTKVSFGIGIDPGFSAADNPGFTALANSEGLFANAAFTNVQFTGTFTSATVTSPTNFVMKTTQTPSNSNYRTVSLPLPTKALVRTNITPEIHVIADVSKILDGTNKIALSGHVTSGEALLESGEILDLISVNIPEMFTVAHVHND